MAVGSGHGEECSALRRLIILLLARNMMLDRQGFTRKNVTLNGARRNACRHPSFPEELDVFAEGSFKSALGISVR